MDTRDERIVVQVTKAEKAKFERRAKRTNRTLGEHVRQTLHNEADTADSTNGKAA